jgi:ABC-type dipeptide/oligopeptide/nickel transport system ATPase component
MRTCRHLPVVYAGTVSEQNPTLEMFRREQSRHIFSLGKAFLHRRASEGKGPTTKSKPRSVVVFV